MTEEAWFDEIRWADADSYSAPSRVVAREKDGTVKRDANGDLILQRCPSCGGQIFHHIFKAATQFEAYMCPFCEWRTAEALPREPHFYLDGVEVFNDQTEEEADTSES